MFSSQERKHELIVKPIVDNVKPTEEKHWSEVFDYFWCTYTDESKTRIAGVWHKDRPHPENAVLVCETEFNQIQKEPEEIYVQRFKLTSVDDLYRLAELFDSGSPKPLYRGQSNYEWNLATHLERDTPEFVIKETGLERYEHKIMSDAQQRFHEFFTQLPEENDYLSWLALLRHRGVPTRLLDVTRSLFIACYFALRDSKPETDAAIWIFSPLAINGSFSRWCYKCNSTWLRPSIFTVAEYNESLNWPFPKNPHSYYKPPTIEELKLPYGNYNLNYVLTIDAAMRGFVDKPGVAIVEPSWLSRRLDFQQGAFLVPFNVRYDFEHNLFTYLDMSKEETVEQDISKDTEELRKLWYKFKIIKLRIPVHLHAILKIKLATMNIRDLTLFPDLDGVLSHVSDIKPRK